MLSIEKFNKRARAKYVQGPLLDALISLNSRYQKRYQDTKMCSGLIYQDNGKLTSRYCGNRWCRICNRIRTGKLLNGYKPALQNMKDQQFLTLTVPNVTGNQLRATIQKMISTVRRIQEIRRQKENIPGINCIRKLECTYNVEHDNYHPHFHFIIDGLTEAEYLRDMWLKFWPDANPKGQKIVKAYNAKELFKYFTKLTSKSSKKVDRRGKCIINEEDHYPEALDLIFQAIEKIRIVQPMGKIKMVSDDIEELTAEKYDETITDDPENKFFMWNGKNWFSPYTGNLLTSFEPNKQLIKFASRIKFRNMVPVT